jgi:hypothetical protein
MDGECDGRRGVGVSGGSEPPLAETASICGIRRETGRRPFAACDGRSGDGGEAAATTLLSHRRRVVKGAGCRFLISSHVTSKF